MLAKRYMNCAEELKHNWQENKKQQVHARDLYPATRQSKGIILDAAKPDASNVSSVKTRPGIERAMKFGHYYLEGVVSSVKKHTMKDALKSRYEAQFW